MPLPVVTSRLSSAVHSLWPQVPQGIYGDAAHAKRESDHNRVTTSGKTGPRAIDFMGALEDQRNDLRAWILQPRIRRIYRISLFIDRRTLYSARNGWRGRPYHGESPHIDHAHISCDA